MDISAITVLHFATESKLIFASVIANALLIFAIVLSTSSLAEIEKGGNSRQ
ncbi:MAG: hypothetical protein IJL63_00475 [Clostridia bacterium]|nr:hypothetical protein [Clostridia bacterium]